MFDSILTGLAGLFAFSRGLDVISNNVSNLNTPGFKGSELQFRDLFYRQQLASELDGRPTRAQVGSGVAAESTTLRLAQGSLQNTGNQTDAAIDGNGFFVLRSADETVYSRAGEFDFDAQDFLVGRTSRKRVAGIDAAGRLVDISIAGLRTNPPRATSRISLTNNLSLGSTNFDLPNVQAYDAAGGSRTLDIKFTNNNSTVPGSWLMEVRDENSTLLPGGNEIRFQPDGSPAAGYNSVTVTLTAANGATTPVEIFFGSPGSLTQATSFSGGSTSTLSVASQDGQAGGAMTSVAFDRFGVLTVSYSNGQSAIAGRLALAAFRDVQALTQLGNGEFLAPKGVDPVIAAPTEGPVGAIQGQNIELSNVDLTQEFTDLIIVQRGFQASSQVVSISNEMLQQLLNMGRPGK